MTITLEQLVTTYGYLALLLGTFFEGETILIFGGFLAHRGYLHLPLVILAAFFGGFLADELSFFAGRWKGEARSGGEDVFAQYLTVMPK